MVDNQLFKSSFKLRKINPRAGLSAEELAGLFKKDKEIKGTRLLFVIKSQNRYKENILSSRPKIDIAGYHHIINGSLP